MKRKIIEWLKWYLVCVIVGVIITFGWQGLELLIYGEVQHRLVDDIIGLMLQFSVVLNIVFIRSFVRFIKGK